LIMRRAFEIQEISIARRKVLIIKQGPEDGSRDRPNYDHSCQVTQKQAYTTTHKY